MCYSQLHGLCSYRSIPPNHMHEITYVNSNRTTTCCLCEKNICKKNHACMPSLGQQCFQKLCCGPSMNFRHEMFWKLPFVKMVDVIFHFPTSQCGLFTWPMKGIHNLTKLTHTYNCECLPDQCSGKPSRPHVIRYLPTQDNHKHIGQRRNGWIHTTQNRGLKHKDRKVCIIRGKRGKYIAWKQCEHL